MGRPASRTPSPCPSAARRLHNRLACGTVAERLLEALGEFHFRVGTVGSGRVGRRHGGVPAPRLPRLQLVGVDVDPAYYDDVQWAPAATAFHATRMLHQRHGL
jgi:hypothetical protein